MGIVAFCKGQLQIKMFKLDLWSLAAGFFPIISFLIKFEEDMRFGH